MREKKKSLLQPQLRVSRLDTEKAMYPHSPQGGLSTIKLQLSVYERAVRQIKCGSSLRERMYDERQSVNIYMTKHCFHLIAL